MRCLNCGSELEDGVLFCRECGAKVDLPKRFCRDCGEPLPEGSKFCSKCGSAQEFQQSVNKSSKAAPNKQRIILFSVAGVGVLLITLVLGIYFIGGKSSNGTGKASSSSTNLVFDEIVPNFTGTDTIKAGTQYAYMSDAWNVYIATAITDNVIKVEAWGKGSQSSKKVKFQSDLGTFDIHDEETGFSWVDESHTTFTLVIKDRNNYTRIGKAKLVLFTLNINDSDENKGTDYDENIACYVYERDDWTMYRAIPLTDNLIKIECWYRVSSGFWSPFLYGWDVGIIDTENTDTDFSWGSDHGAFAITMKDPNSDVTWKKEELTSFVLENKDYQYASVKDYLKI